MTEVGHFLDLPRSFRVSSPLLLSGKDKFVERRNLSIAN
jgi:hypothetical protein